MTRFPKSAGLASLVALAMACGQESTAPQDGGQPGLNPAIVQAPGRYIVRFRDNEANAAGQSSRLAQTHRGRVAYTYRHAIKGFAGDFSAQDIAALSRDPSVLAIEPDQMAYAIATQPSPPSWGLDRIDQTALPLSSSYTYNATGAGVTVYIIDTGIWYTHNEFGGRAVPGIDEITIGGTATDCNGHGTHVAGTVGGSSYGVAKGVTLVAVRVLDCAGSGPYSQVIAGVDWVTQQKLANPNVPMAANMSLGGGLSSALNAAVTNSIAAGVTYALAAGNSSADACTQSPAATPNALTVAATTTTDARASYSNFGTCVDIFAPGSSITSAWYTSNSASNTINGTSMASPHVAGAAALYLQLNPQALPAAVATALINNATSNVVGSPGTGSPNKLLYTGFIGGGPPPPGQPVANFSFSCNQLNCSFDGSGSTAQSNATYTWVWGDGTANGTGKTPAHIYGSPGTRNVTLTVADAGGSNSQTKSVTTTVPPPVVVITYNCVGLTCNFDGTGSTAQPNATYLWTWDAGVTTPGKTATFTWPTPGLKPAKLTITDQGGTSFLVVKFTLTTAPPPQPVASFTFNCALLNCSFDGSGSTAQANATYTWVWGDGTANGSGKTPIHNYATGGTRSVTLTVSDAGGSNSVTQSVTTTAPPPQPVANFTFSCTLLNCSFDGNSSTAQANATFTWVWGDGTANGSGKTPTHSYGSAGTRNVTLTVSDAGGSNSITKSVTVAGPPPPQPVASFTFSCTLLNCSFDGNGSTAQPNATFTWVWGDGTANGSGKTPSHSYATGGTRSVTLTVSDAGGSNSVTQSVTTTAPLPQPVANFTFSCTLLDCSFDGNTSTAQANATYTWVWGDGTSNGSGKTATHSYTTTGAKSVTLTVADAGGSNSITKSVTITVPPPVVVITTNCTGLTCTLNGSGSTALPNATYLWTWDAGQTTPGKIVTHTWPTPGLKPARLTITDAGGTSFLVVKVTLQ